MRAAERSARLEARQLAIDKFSLAGKDFMKMVLQFF
jgi:hypothetical protein